jgi:endonuclease-3
LKKLRNNYRTPRWTTKCSDPFETLIVTIISQNTADQNTARAFRNLSNTFKITPEALANAETHKIENALKVGGLYRNKAKIIKQVSKLILEKYEGDLKRILSLPLDEARRTLMQLPGIGPKTADVTLLFCTGKPTIPVDTHVNRVAKRLGLAPAKANYEAVRRSLQSLYDPKDYLPVHVLLILHGRKYCKARNPYCPECPIKMLCPSKNLGNRND